MSDTERQRTYDAEQIARVVSEHGGTVDLFGTAVTWPSELRFGELEHVQRYVDSVMSRPFFCKAYPKAASAPVIIRQRKGDACAHYERFPRPTIAVHQPVLGTGWAMRELVLLHELAHHANAFDGAGESHGPEFRGAFVHLVAEVIGPEAGWVLQTMFFDAGLRMTVTTS